MSMMSFYRRNDIGEKYYVDFSRGLFFLRNPPPAFLRISFVFDMLYFIS